LPQVIKKILGLRGIWFYAAVVLVVLSVWTVQVHVYRQVFSAPGTIFSASPGTPAAPSQPSDWQKMSVQAMTESNRLLTTLATAMLGALGLLVGSKAQDGSGSGHMWAAFLGALSGTLSLYFGYVSHLNLLAMISNQNPNPYDHVYLFSSHAQFYTLIAGAFFLADFAAHYMSQEKPK
jgi:hypothetical protein